MSYLSIKHKYCYHLHIVQENLNCFVAQLCLLRYYAIFKSKLLNQYLLNQPQYTESYQAIVRMIL